MVDERRYRPAIDGLRGIAVLAVLLFHLGAKGFDGGFIGVDVFFVISGYLITRTTFEDLVTRRVTLGAFFLRRVRRLAPHHLVVLGASTIAAVFLLTPVQLRNFGESLVAQGVYVQNFAFLAQGDYFWAAHQRPLLHTWSLAVEEQFYLAYALAIVAARRWGERVALAFAVGALVSFAGAWLVTTVSPSSTFYLLPTRAWELALGVLAAFAAPKIGDRARGWLAPGLALVAWAIFGFGEGARLPGPQSIAACVGTAFVLLAAEATTTLHRLLDNRPLVAIGQRSYAIYLWHWPLVTFAMAALGRSLRPREAFAVCVATFALAWLGTAWIEVPIRRGRGSARGLVRGVVGAGAALAAVGGFAIATDGMTFRYPDTLAVLYRAQVPRNYRCPIVGRLVAPREELCKINRAESSTNVLVLGDSHADVLDELIGELAAREGIGAYLTKRDCKLYDFGPREDCSDAVLARVRDEIAAHQIKFVFAMAFTKNFFSEERLRRNAEKLLGSVEGIYVMQVVPHGDYFSPAVRASALKGERDAPPAYTMAHYREENAIALAALRRLADARGAIRILDPSAYLCAAETCAFDTAGVPNYFDDHHLTPAGAWRLAPAFVAALREIGRPASTLAP